MAPMVEAQAITERTAVRMADTGQSGNAAKSTSWLLQEPPGGAAPLTLGGVASSHGSLSSSAWGSGWRRRKAQVRSCTAAWTRAWLSHAPGGVFTHLLHARSGAGHPGQLCGTVQGGAGGRRGTHPVGSGHRGGQGDLGPHAVLAAGPHGGRRVPTLDHVPAPRSAWCPAFMPSGRARAGAGTARATWAIHRSPCPGGKTSLAPWGTEEGVFDRGVLRTEFVTLGY